MRGNTAFHNGKGKNRFSSRRSPGSFVVSSCLPDSKRTSAQLDLGEGIVRRSLDPTVMRVWVTEAGKPMRLGEVPAKDEESLGWVKGKGGADD